MIIGSRNINHTTVQMFQTRFNTIIVVIGGTDKREYIGSCNNDMIDAIWALMAQELEA